jgi:hypothetical protein
MGYPDLHSIVLQPLHSSFLPSTPTRRNALLIKVFLPLPTRVSLTNIAIEPGELSNVTKAPPTANEASD